MKKSDKKMDNAIRVALTQVCEAALKEVDGFEWLTHLVDYKDFPKSLKVICVFDSNQHLTALTSANTEEYFRLQVQEKLAVIGVHLLDVKQQVKFDTEEACESENQGNWQKRFQHGT